MKSALLFALFGSAAAVCPNACSGHGSCGRFDRCDCYAGFQGGDCAGKTCAFTTAWSDMDGHSYAECGNRGECNRDTGLCECYEGYTGKGCARLACPDDCGGHGTCELMGEVNSNYNAWDKNKIMTCKCDPGYSGPGCTSRMCIRGDDPMSVKKEGSADAQQNQISTIEISHSADVTSGDFTLVLTDWRGESWETWPIKLTGVAPTGIEVKEALEALPMHAVPEVEVSMASDLLDDRRWEVTFMSTSNSGLVDLTVNNVACTAQGCQPVVQGVTADVVTVTNPTGASLGAATTESLVCSDRGDCDADNGLCVCYEGYMGEACEAQTIII